MQMRIVATTWRWSKTVSSGFCISTPIFKMNRKMTLYHLQWTLQPVLQFAITAPGICIPGILSPFLIPLPPVTCSRAIPQKEVGPQEEDVGTTTSTSPLELGRHRP
jgi:hypothetical protein